MGVGDRVREIFGGAPRIRVHVIVRGRIGDGWYDVDQRVPLPEGATLGDLLERGEARGIPFSAALEHSPHLSHTLMLNGERCPVADNRDRVLGDGDQVYLLAPLAGG
jgi:molybdopterin converting factor small subunit